ncbi:MAG: TraR/DksA C4-type zinc finger protein [Rhodospirillum sp.]|nr:TraR/DksA C4-type zinc finger protein [Rhodospirillum sp.]MCF8491373.1 TraR/DksA C4-type zinc finger protein [Rhodospirillum sp.]MCF8500197.1 TraR/DksA C4-type zinc finger protein [Rhodospirillum sp.]
MADDADRAQEAAEMRLALALSAHERRPQVNGNGFCRDCGCEIPAGRLAILPRAPRCLDCQDDHERISRA